MLCFEALLEDFLHCAHFEPPPCARYCRRRRGQRRKSYKSFIAEDYARDAAHARAPLIIERAAVAAL